MELNMIKLLTTCLLLASSFAYAKCEIKWVDHDYNSLTPAIAKQLCDSTLDLPAINNPGIRPIQQPQIRPLPRISIPPIGTKNCNTQSVFENGRWVNKQVCY